MRSFYLASLLLLGSFSNVSAFDFAGMAQMATPLVSSALGSNPLVKNLTSSLGVTQEQAIGGSAALLGEAKKDMKPADFKSLTSSMPAVGSLLAAAPASTSPLASQFAKLGMKPEMVDKFTPFLLDYVKSGTTPARAQLVQAALQ
jgi:hypothetical protein